MDDAERIIDPVARWQALRDEAQLWADTCDGYINPETLRDLARAEAALAEGATDGN